MSARQFLSWVRRGAATGIITEDPLNGPIPSPPLIRPHLALEMDGAAVPNIEGPTLQLIGPGRVVGFDQHLITRMHPTNGACNGLANELAYIEFSRADLPWLFTPAAPNKEQNNRLRPWMVLIVVPEGALDSLNLAARPLPLITLSTRELPNLADSWAWAHTQVPAADEAGIKSVLDTGHPETRSRLLCPRRLTEESAYLAFVVPAFEGGRRAGLGDLRAADGNADLRPAWNTASNSKVTLPVYCSWTFRTGPREGFEDLARKLKRAPVHEIPGFGTREVDVRNPWPNLRPLAALAGDEPDAAESIALDGALKIPGPPPEGSLSARARNKFVSLLEDQLNFPSTVGAARSNDPEKRCVTAPLYGSRFNGLPKVPGDDSWPRDLNLDIRRRIAASYGARYVQQQQEFLMARAWDQLPDIERANRLRRLGELAAVTADALHRRHIAKLNTQELIAVAAPARARTFAAAGLTLQQKIVSSPLPNAAATPAFTRAARPNGLIARSFRAAEPARIVDRSLAGELAISAVTTLTRRWSIAAPLRDKGIEKDSMLVRAHASSQLVAGSERSTVALGLASLQQVVDARVPGATQTLARAKGFLERIGGPVTPALVRAQPTEIATHLIEADRAGGALAALNVFSQYLTEQAGNTFKPVQQQPLATAGTPLEANALRATLVTSLTPSRLIIKRLADRILIPPALQPVDPLGPVMAGPQFPAPLALALFQDKPDLLLPGVGNFPPNAVTLLETNPPFIESLLVGANHEMNRELLWREFPTDQRGTPFRHFWPRPGGAPEIGPIASWSKRLGGNLSGGVGEQIVLLVRGELLRRFPGTVVFAARARRAEAAPHALDMVETDTRVPEFAMRLSEDTSIYAFKLTEEEVRGGGGEPGWFFVFQEPLTAPAFGFDLKSAETPAFKSWNDLTWDQVPQDRERFAFAGNALAPPANSNNALWNRTAADIAQIALQRPYRMAFHANVLLKG